jgi:preprotein translocase subunit SecD
MNSRNHLWISLALVAFFAFLGWYFVLNQRSAEARPFRFGLDLVGGVELIYRADVTNIDDVDGAMDTLKEVMERRINVFGVSEPIIQVERAGVLSGNPDNRLIIELPGYRDIEEAKRSIGETPILEFRLLRREAATNLDPNQPLDLDTILEPASLTGRYLLRARVEFDQTTRAAYVALEFNREGAEIFAQITRNNIGQVLAIVLDGEIIQMPTIQDAITDGQAVITGQFTPEEARTVVRNLNYGALPVPINLISESAVGATLGEEALNSGVRAGIIGFIILSIFMIVWYRLPGVVAMLGLLSYLIMLLVLFKLIPVTLTAAGIAGFILSLGMAVDANILIFERLKEELKRGKNIKEAIDEGFARAWTAIRDSNISSIITAIILFWIGTAGVKGFALTFGLGVGVSMLSAIVVSRTLLLALVLKNDSAIMRKLFSNGLS